MQKLNYWIIGLLVVLVGINASYFFPKKDTTIESLKSQNDSLKMQLNAVKLSVELMDANLKKQLSKVDSSISLSRSSITTIETNIRNVRNNLNGLRQTDPNTYYQSLSKTEKEKLKQLMYQDVTWEK